MEGAVLEKAAVPGTALLRAGRFSPLLLCRDTVMASSTTYTNGLGGPSIETGSGRTKGSGHGSAARPSDVRFTGRPSRGLGKLAARPLQSRARHLARSEEHT